MNAIVFKLIALLVFVTAQAGCTTRVPRDPALATIDISRLPFLDLSLNIPGLSSCTISPDTTIHLTSKEPVIVIVHGCYGSAARYRALAQVFAFHGQQAVCFNYSDRESLTKTSAQLINVLELLSSKTHSRQITVIGHSQGGLIARKALVKEREVRYFIVFYVPSIIAHKPGSSPMNVETHCLGSLCLMDGTGYGIKKLFEEAFRHFNFASYSSIYPLLNRLKHEGKLDCIEINQTRFLAEHAAAPEGWPECAS